MSGPALKVTPSSLSKGTAARGDLKNYSAQLQALDRNGDGQLDLDEVCDAIDEIVKKQKTEKTLKWLLAALALFSLLTIAATVGLTYAVVVMSKDTEVNGPVLQSKDTGEALRTGSFLQSQNATALVNAVTSADDPSAALARVTSIKVPSLKEGEAYTVHKVDAITMLLNNSVLVRTATGMNVLMPVASLVGAAEEAANATETTQVPGRKLMQGNTISVTVNQGPDNYRTYTLSGINPQSTSVGAIKGAIADKPLGPFADTIKLFLGATELTDDLQKLSKIDGFSASTPLTIQTRQVVVWAWSYCAADELDCINFRWGESHTVYLPVGSTVLGIKREMQAKHNTLVDEQNITPFEAGENHELADTVLISDIGTNCPSTTDCKVDDYGKIIPLA